MNRSVNSLLFCISTLLLAAPNAFAQSSTAARTPQGSQDRVLQELLGEVRQLRVALERATVNGYRAQLALERLRLQEEKVRRLAGELGGIKDQLSELASARLTASQKLEWMVMQYEAGVHSGEGVNETKLLVEQLKLKEVNLAERERLLSLDLENERGSLSELNRRLEVLELEMILSADGEEIKRNTKRN